MQALLPRSTTPLAAILAIALCAIGFCAFGAEGSSAAGRYVAFGDSGTTGSGLGPQSPGSRAACQQTETSYPVMLKSMMGISDFATAACSLAWINDLTTPQVLYDGETAPPQFDALVGTETLVTISMGDNDAGYGEVVRDCLSNTTTGTPCRDKYVTNGVNRLAERAQTFLSSPLGDAIDEARRRSPNAEIWVIGYPRLIPENISNCPGRVDVSAGDAPVVNEWQMAINDTEKAATAAHGAYYVDVYSQSEGHDACQPSEAARWTYPRPSSTPSPAWAYHPTAAGHSAVAQLFLNAFNSPRPPRGTTPAGQTLGIAFRSRKVRPVTSRLPSITTKPPPKFGAKLTVKLARSGSVRFVVDRAKAGWIKGGRCRSMSKRNRAGRKTCTRFVRVRSKTTLALPGGTSNVYFTGRAGGKRLASGRYRLRAATGSLSARTPIFSLSR